MTGPWRRDLGRILTLAWPVLVGQLAVVGFSTVDTVLVARYSPADLAALSVGAAAYITVFIGLMGVVLALGPIVGQLFGAGQRAAAGRALHQAVWVALALSLLGGMLLAFPAPFLALSQAPDEVASRIRGYLLALAVALPAALLVQAYRGFNNAISRPKAVMALQLSGLMAKVPLSALLVFGAPSIGLPAMGVLGCGVATAIVMWLMALAAWQILRRDHFYKPFALLGRGLDAPDLQAIGNQLKLGIPMGLAIMVEVSAFSLMAVFVARLGLTASGGHQIAANLTAIMFMVPLALSSATMTLVAQRAGAHDHEDARRLGWHGLKLGVAVALAMAVALFAARGQLARLYTNDAAILAAAAPLLAWLAVYHVADALQAMASFVLRAYHIATLPVLIYAGAVWGIGMGGGYSLAFNTTGHTPQALQGAPGYWAAAAFGQCVAGLVLTWLMAHALATAVRSAPRPAEANAV